MTWSHFNINLLPDIILEEIFRNIQPKLLSRDTSELQLYQGVCTTWRRILHPLSWESIPTGYFAYHRKIRKKRAKLVRDLDLSSLPPQQRKLKGFTRVRKLAAFVGTQAGDLALLRRALCRFTFLRYLDLDYHTAHSLKETESLTYLRHLRFASFTISESRLLDLISQSLPKNLKSLELRTAGSITTRILEAISRSLPLLRHLRLEELDPAQLGGELSTGFPNLWSLHLAFKYGHAGSPFNLVGPSFPRLNTLMIDSSSPVSASGSSWPRLEYLESTFALHVCSTTSCFISVTSLCLRSINTVSASHFILPQLLGRLVNLKKLVVWGELDDDAFDIPSTSIQDVTITLSGSPFSPHFFTWLTERLPELKSLYLRSHEHHGPAYFESSAENELPASFRFGQPRRFKRISTGGLCKRGPLKRRFLRAVSCETGLTYQQLNQAEFPHLVQFSFSRCLTVFPVLLRISAPKLLVFRREACHFIL